MMEPGPVATLADEFLADLGDDDDLNEENGEEQVEDVEGKGKEKESDMDLVEKALEIDDVHKVAKLRSSARLRSITDRIQKFAQEGSSLGSTAGASLEDHPEYELIVEVRNPNLVHPFSI
jgi:hypothetical protein